MTSQHKLTVSCEFFPPRTDAGVVKLREIREQLKALSPEFFSVTFGAGGSTQARTLETVVDIQTSGTPAAPHLSCVASTEENIEQLLNEYIKNGISRIVALRGDTPSGWMGRLGEFAYASELVEFIRRKTGAHFFIEVAAYPEFHPQARSATADLDYFKQKVEAGANGAITQYFYNADAYFRFVDNCAARGVMIPIVPGIMPISNYEQLIRFSGTCGAEVPRWLQYLLKDVQDDPIALQELGLDVVTALCERLIAGGAPGLHFYSLNQSKLLLELGRRLGLLKNLAG